MNNTIVDKTYTAEIIIPASSTKQQILFPTLQNLDSKLTQAVISFNPQTLTHSPTGVVTANLAVMKSIYVTLVQGDVNQIWNIPILSLCTLQSSLSATETIANKYALEFNNLNIIWAKSYIFIANVAAIAATDESVVFDIHYSDFPVQSN